MNCSLTFDRCHWSHYDKESSDGQCDTSGMPGSGLYYPSQGENFISNLGLCRDRFSMCSIDRIIVNQELFHRDIKKYPAWGSLNTSDMIAGVVYIY